MQTSLTHLAAPDGTSVAVRSWLPQRVAPLRPGAGEGPSDDGQVSAASGTRGSPRAVIQVVHGMAEHSARYERFAAAATQRGIGVVADDHRGHGLTAEAGRLGHVADRDGWELVLADLEMVLDAVRASWPGAPVVLLGHSWGSFLVRLLAARRGRDVAGMVVMGTGGDPGPTFGVGAGLASLMGRLRGQGRPSAVLGRLAYAGYNRGLGPVRTEFDWLSRDRAEVDAYIADPWCGFPCSNAFFRDMARGISAAARREVFEATPPDLPVLVTSGTADPVGARGAGPRQVAGGYRRAGVRNVALRLFPEARHELLNETNRDEVTGEILDWVEARI